MDRNALSNFGRGSPKEHFCDFFSKICSAVLEKKLFKANVDDGRTDDGQRSITIAHLEHFVLR